MQTSFIQVESSRIEKKLFCVCKDCLWNGDKQNYLNNCLDDLESKIIFLFYFIKRFPHLKCGCVISHGRKRKWHGDRIIQTHFIIKGCWRKAERIMRMIVRNFFLQNFRNFKQKERMCDHLGEVNVNNSCVHCVQQWHFYVRYDIGTQCFTSHYLSNAKNQPGKMGKH